MQQYADIYLLLNYSTCFGHPSRPSSGAHKPVVAASGIDRTVKYKSWTRQWRTQEFCSGGGGSTNSVEDRGQREIWDLGAVAPCSGVLEAAVIWYKEFHFI